MVVALEVLVRSSQSIFLFWINAFPQMFVHCANTFLHSLTENQQVLQLHKIESMSEWSARKSHNRLSAEAARVENVFDQGHDFTGNF